PTLLVRVHLLSGCIESFIQEDPGKASSDWLRMDPRGLFARPRLVIAGTRSKTVFVCSETTRIDLIQEAPTWWQFPPGSTQLLELSESEFRQHTHRDQPELMPKGERATAKRDRSVSYLKLQFRGGSSIFLMAESSVALPAERHFFMNVLLSKAA